MADRLGDAAEEVIHDAGDLFRAKLVFKISRGSPTGRLYKRGAKTHRASAPGQPPATDTGTLVRSVFVDKMPGAVVVGSNLVYAAHLERGTMTSGGYMAPRPAWQPTQAEMDRELPAMIEQRVGAVIR